MKKLILLACLISMNAYAGNLFSQISGMTWDEVKTNKYTIDTAGINPRVYEFIPENAKDHLCVIVFPNSDGKHTAAIPAMQCFKVK